MTETVDILNTLPETASLEDLCKAEIRAKIANLEAERKTFDLQYEAKNIDLQAHKWKNSQNLIYTFYGPVVPMQVNDCIQTLSAMARKAPGEEITILLNTQGGSVFDGLGLYDYIQHIKTLNPVTVKAFGMAASMGAVLLQAGTRRIMQPNASIMMHESSIDREEGYSWSTSEIEDQTKLLKEVQAGLYEILAQRSTMTPTQIKRRCNRKEAWIKAKEALELGLIDAIEV